jgi:hypothetical protein
MLNAMEMKHSGTLVFHVVVLGTSVLLSAIADGLRATPHLHVT